MRKQVVESCVHLWIYAEWNWPILCRLLPINKWEVSWWVQSVKIDQLQSKVKKFVRVWWIWCYLWKLMVYVEIKRLG